jgi:hypothetical protein
MLVYLVKNVSMLSTMNDDESKNLLASGRKLLKYFPTSGSLLASALF